MHVSYTALNNYKYRPEKKKKKLWLHFTLILTLISGKGKTDFFCCQIILYIIIYYILTVVNHEIKNIDQLTTLCL